MTRRSPLPEDPTLHRTHIALINKFYSCFQKLDYQGMQECYADQAVFNDAIFENLNSDEVKAMWEMLCKTGKAFTLTFGNIAEAPGGVSAEWTATYLFARTGKTVINKVQARFAFENEKIISHTDTFDFYQWAKQAFGFTGLLLGWTPFFKSKVQVTAREGLHHFMTRD